MRLRALLAAAGIGVALACAKPSAVDLRELLPEQGSLDDWTVAEGPLEYGPDDLYDYLDGGAERYLGYGFRRLVHVRYESPGEEHSGVTLDLFDMGSRLGAFGIYSAGRRPDMPPEKWGAEGWTDGDVAHAWKETVYLHGMTDRSDPDATAMLRRIMAGAAGGIPGDALFPELLNALPVDGRVPRSEQYVASDLMGHGFLGGGVMASYRIGDCEAQMFFTDAGSESAADDAVARLRSHWQDRARVDGISSPGRGGLRYSDAELGSGSAVSAGSFVAGVQCSQPGLAVAAQQRLLTDLVSRLLRAEG